LAYNAALATAYGLDPDEALRSVTINAAQIWGVADR
jgi:imidazolonepropionase-like amidohydrolase